MTIRQPSKSMRVSRFEEYPISFARSRLYDLTILPTLEPGWRNGIRRGLKILWSESSVRVRVPPPALKKPITGRIYSEFMIAANRSRKADQPDKTGKSLVNRADFPPSKFGLRRRRPADIPVVLLTPR